MSLASEFKTFINRGNVMDLAIGVIIGGAFGKIVSSFVEDMLMPLIGVVLGGVSFKNLAFQLGEKVNDKGEKVANMLSYGNFIQTIVDFLIIAFVIFMVIKALNRMKMELPTPAPTPTESLLGEIRDLLRK